VILRSGQGYFYITLFYENPFEVTVAYFKVLGCGPGDGIRPVKVLIQSSSDQANENVNLK
jgi:hypothetical protein